MKTVKNILDAKGNDVFSAAPSDTVYDAVKIMADKGVGALIVLDDGKLVGRMHGIDDGQTCPAPARSRSQTCRGRRVDR